MKSFFSLFSNSYYSVPVALRQILIVGERKKVLSFKMTKTMSILFVYALFEAF